MSGFTPVWGYNGHDWGNQPSWYCQFFDNEIIEGNGWGHESATMHNTRANDYGIFQLYLDGQELGGPIDLYNAENVTKLVSLGERRLSGGQHRLLVEIVGANPAAKPRHMFGLDCVKLEPVQ
jgi:hypothetical protein